MPKSEFESASPLGLSKLELAKALGVCESTVMSWMARKVIPHYKIAGGMVRFQLPEVLAALKKYRVPALTQKLASSRGRSFPPRGADRWAAGDH
jgi:excisionase family DNA binding protein